ncbi:MAG: DNA-directed RNA polymerase subunit beta, partial [Oscillospiraceae bacterium]|nr:DNA-directed RNA polymerase subunit beta [Oscillospiraceae bacterium]
MAKPNPIHLGKRTRMSFARVKEALEVPDLIEIQKNSYKSFLKDGMREVLADVSPITDYSESLILEFTDYSLDDAPKYTQEVCKERDATYAAPLKVTVRLTNRDTHEIKESEVFMGDFPLMTENGTFIINGAERVIVSQLVRSPGVYYSRTIDKSGDFLYSSQMIPNRGAWIEYETDANGVIYARIDRARKLPVTVLLRALGIETDAEIIRLFGDDERVSATITRDAPSVNDKGENRYKSRKDQALI